MDNECIIVFIGAKKFLNFTCARAIIRSALIEVDEKTSAHVISEADEELFNSRTMKLLKFFCSRDKIVFVIDDTRVTKIYDERTNRPGTVDMDAALVIKDRVNAMRGMGECKEIVAVDISNLEHEADLRGRGLEINELSETLDLVVEQIKRILTRNN